MAMLTSECFKSINLLINYSLQYIYDNMQITRVFKSCSSRWFNRIIGEKQIHWFLFIVLITYK